MPVNLNSKAIAAAFGIFADATVLIERDADTANPVLKSTTTVYSGACDFQSGGGTQYRNPSGVVDIADAFLSINPDASGNLPAVEVGDRATVTQKVNGVAQTPVVYNVDNVSVFTSLLPHVELFFKRGPVRNELK